MRYRLNFAISLICVLLILSAPTKEALASTVVISDGDMNPTDYQLVTEGSAPGAASLNQVPIGGNPGSFLQVDQSGQATSVFSTTILNTFVFNVSQTYDPSSGAINSLTYSEDSLSVSRNANNAPNGTVVLRQDGIIFIGQTTFIPGTTNTSFTNSVLEDLTASDFGGLVGGTVFPTANPDFSNAGSEIEFGFYRVATGRGAVFTQDIFGVDNFRIELAIEEVPEPSSIVLLGCTILLFSGPKRV